MGLTCQPLNFRTTALYGGAERGLQPRTRSELSSVAQPRARRARSAIAAAGLLVGGWSTEIHLSGSRGGASWPAPCLLDRGPRLAPPRPTDAPPWPRYRRSARAPRPVLPVPAPRSRGAG